MIASYFLAYYLIPKYAVAKRKLVYIIICIASIYFISVLGRVLIVYLSESLTRTPPFQQESLWQIMTEWKHLILKYVPHIYSVVFGFLFLKFFLHYTHTQQRALKADKEKVAAELRLLKAQLNPHFLFNTLNNIYVLALEKSSKTAYSIEKLSEILDYILYRCTDKFTSLLAEIHMLENYIELEKLRYDDRLVVTFQKHIEEDVKIAPLILLSFVENAFKHGAGEDSGSPRIEISVTYEKGLFIFQISNTVSDIPKEERATKIGLVNITKQLDLLYKDQYDLKIIEQDGLFTVTLKIAIDNES
ncbi:histidine kinase [Aquimarina litoralis]|nr:histidine kinase [Aquimarina litoralis]